MSFKAWVVLFVVCVAIGFAIGHFLLGALFFCG